MAAPSTKIAFKHPPKTPTLGVWLGHDRLCLTRVEEIPFKAPPQRRPEIPFKAPPQNRTGIPLDAPPQRAVHFKPPHSSIEWIWTGYNRDLHPSFWTELPEPINLLLAAPLGLDADDAQKPNEGSQPTIYEWRSSMKWMYLDTATTGRGTEDEYALYWQMVDEPFHEELNKKMADGEAEAELTFDNWKYKVDLEKMEMTRTLKKRNGKTHALTRVEMVEMEGSRPDRKAVLHGWEFTGHWQFVWQYKDSRGWKNFEPIANHQALRASYSQPTVTVIHAWQHRKKGVLEENHTVDFQAMTQNAEEGRNREQPVRLVAYRTPVVEMVVV
jgi:hypothetical protein